MRAPATQSGKPGRVLRRVEVGKMVEEAKAKDVNTLLTRLLIPVGYLALQGRRGAGRP